VCGNEHTRLEDPYVFSDRRMHIMNCVDIASGRRCRECLRERSTLRTGGSRTSHTAVRVSDRSTVGRIEVEPCERASLHHCPNRRNLGNIVFLEPPCHNPPITALFCIIATALQYVDTWSQCCLCRLAHTRSHARGVDCLGRSSY
jgi:hypothetical protein